MSNVPERELTAAIVDAMSPQELREEIEVQAHALMAIVDAMRWLPTFPEESQQTWDRSQRISQSASLIHHLCYRLKEIAP